MKLYHGSYTEISVIDLKKSKPWQEIYKLVKIELKFPKQKK